MQSVSLIALHHSVPKLRDATWHLTTLPSHTAHSTNNRHKEPRFMTRIAILLRGVNVGGKHKLPMAELKQCCEMLGILDCTTHLNSGNAVGSLAAAKVDGFAASLARALEKRCGFGVPVVVRTASALKRTIAANPFLAENAAPASLHVAFLDAKPATAKVRALDPARSPGDRFILQGSEVFLHLPHGVARTKLTNAWMDSSLGVTSTQRNWATVLALAELLDASD